jgi:hypothetical protein
VAASKKLPDVANMIDDIGRDRLMYLVGQRIGSHHVHGTWPSLVMHYLEKDNDGQYAPRDHDCETNVNQFVFTPLVVISAARAFSAFVAQGQDISSLLEYLEAIEQEVVALHYEISARDP